MSGLLMPPDALFARPRFGKKTITYDLPTPPAERADDVFDKPESMAHAVDDLKAVAKATNEKVVKAVNLVKPVEPPVTYLEILKFIWWSLLVVLTQAWRDVKARKFYVPLLKTDFMTHYFYIPVGRRDPRLVTSGPHNRMVIRKIPESASRQYEEVGDLDSFENTEIVNCASNNYGGFSRLEFGSERVIEAALRQLPFCPPPAALEEQVRLQCASYMGFDSAFTAPSGFSTNVLAFATVAGVASNEGRSLVFLMDRDCHNSMFTGAFYNKGAKIHKFDHNDLNDLEFKLRMYREQDPSAFICVAVEGIYSMEGSISPGPAILALKEVYRFCLLIDEAHSFMALGSNGRGSFNHWQDAGYRCPLDGVDVMSCMFSKSVGCTGGFVLANGPFAAELRRQGEILTTRGIEKLSTIVLLRILGLLRKPLFIQHRMRLVQEKAGYVARALTAAGCKVLSSTGSAIICFPVGTVRQVALFHGEAMKHGMAIVGGVPPATPLWGCRVRLCVFATTTWPDIHRLLNVTIKISLSIGVRGVRATTFDDKLLQKEDFCDAVVEQQCNTTDEQLLEYVDALSDNNVRGDSEVGGSSEVIQAGVQGLRKYGIGPCSARWFYGSFDSFIKLERRLASLYPSLVKQSGHCRAMVCGDAEVTIGSTLSALVIPTASSTTTNAVFVSSTAPHGVLSGVAMDKASSRVTRNYYTSVSAIPEMLDLSKPTHLTFYFLTAQKDGSEILDLGSLFQHPVFKTTQAKNNISSVTILLDDRNGLGKVGPRQLGYLDLMESRHGASFLTDTFAAFSGGKRAAFFGNTKVRVMVAGSWYDAFGHQGGYVTGHAASVEALTWDAKAYFFSTPPMPLQACMTDRAIELLQQGYGKEGQ
ncbi:MAG: hypothetical protein LQ350_004737 [Teloschistes chrysophthalmus]|nr:MAG: hypothetical protein LQ350_004737 [Niorma chrysophthalma]